MNKREQSEEQILNHFMNKSRHRMVRAYVLYFVYEQQQQE